MVCCNPSQGSRGGRAGALRTERELPFDTLQSHQHLCGDPDGKRLNRGDSGSIVSNTGLEYIASLVSLQKETATVHIHAVNGIPNDAFELGITCPLPLELGQCVHPTQQAR